MKSKFFLVIALFFVFSAYTNAQTETAANTQKLTWYSWEEGYKKAKNEGKIMLVDAYTDWCGWCKVMDNKTYTDANVISKIKADFVPIKLNPEHKGVYKYNGKEYAGRALITVLSNSKFSGYPTTFFVFPKTHKSYMEVGYLEAKVFAAKLDKYKNMN